MGEALLMRSRKYPFRTKLEPDYAINWGMEKKDGTFEEREKRPIELFDLKTFVSEEKRKKMLESNPSGIEPMPNPFGGMMGANPFSGFGQNKLDNMPNPFKPNPMADIDIDKVMADIDKKLKELEEEEEREKKNNISTTESKEKTNKENINEQKEKPVFELPKNIEIDNGNKLKENKDNSIEKNDKPKINVDVDSVIVNDNIITDDEFFDDFFQDE